MINININSNDINHDSRMFDRTSWASKDLLTIQGFDIGKLELGELSLTYKELNQIAGRVVVGACCMIA